MPPKTKSGGKRSIIKIVLQRGSLPGYTLKDNRTVRRDVLKRLVKKDGWGEIVKRLNVLSIFNKNKHPENAAKFKRDMNFVQKTFDPNYAKKQKSKRKVKSSSAKHTKAKSTKRKSKQTSKISRKRKNISKRKSQAKRKSLARKYASKKKSQPKTKSRKHRSQRGGDCGGMCMV